MDNESRGEVAADSVPGIIAINHGVPHTVQTAEDLSPLIGKSAEWIRESAGVQRRHVSLVEDDPAALVASIARPMIERYGVPELIIHAGAMERQLLPDMSVFIARELKLDGVPGFTVNATCLSFVVALQVATSLIRDGIYDRILICSSEFGTRGRNFREPESAALVGDASAAALLGRRPAPFGVQHFAMETWPSGASLAEVRGGGVMKPPHIETTTADDNLFHMEGERLLRFVLPKLRRFLDKFLKECELDIADVKLVVPHQASAAGLKALQKFGFREEQVLNILADYGNCVAASIPMGLSIAEKAELIHRGDNVLLLGTAAGLSIGAALIRW
jgi:3-oxoacyl-[acyl-carrier-protein] synthase III